MIVITGASGYIGKALLPALMAVDNLSPVVSAGRTAIAGVQHRYLDLASAQGFRDALTGAEAVIHLAGLAHNQGDPGSYEQINVRATMALADAAAAAGARKFIFVSSLNVVPASARDAVNRPEAYPAPGTPYAASKWRAEQALIRLLEHSDCQLSIVRPALVYDRELTANLKTLASIATRFPFALPVSGSRSMVSRPDLVEFLCQQVSPDTVNHPGDAGTNGSLQIIPVTDGECYNARRISEALGGAYALPLPNVLWRAAARIRDSLSGLPAGSTWQSLAGQHWCGASYFVNRQRAGRMSDWQPRYTLETLHAGPHVVAATTGRER